MSDLSKFSYDSEDTKFHDKTITEDKTIKTYSLDNKMEYPYLMLESEELPIYKVQVLSNILTKKKFIQETTPEGFYNVYLTMQGAVIGLGMLHSDNLKSLIQGSLYKEVNKYLMLEPGKRVDGDLMFSYCTNPLY